MTRLFPAPALAVSLLFAVACSNEEDLGNRDPSAADGGDTPSQSDVGTAKGTIGGKSFVPTSAAARAGIGYVHGQDGVPALELVFSSTADVCSTVKLDKFIPGETYVALHGIRAAVGTNTVTDAEVVVVNASCPSGTRLDKQGAPSTSANVVEAGATVTITRLDSERVEGTVSATFEDLSSFEGSFSVVPCAGSGGFGESPVCQ